MLFARVKLIMSADPAVERPAIAQVSVDLNGRLVRAEAAGGTMREAAEQLRRCGSGWGARAGLEAVVAAGR